MCLRLITRWLPEAVVDVVFLENRVLLDVLVNDLLRVKKKVRKIKFGCVVNKQLYFVNVLLVLTSNLIDDVLLHSNFDQRRSYRSDDVFRFLFFLRILHGGVILVFLIWRLFDHRILQLVIYRLLSHIRALNWRWYHTLTVSLWGIRS